jgi:integrase
MKDVMNRVYSVLLRIEDTDFMRKLTMYGFLLSGVWGRPEEVKGLLDEGFVARPDRMAAATQNSGSVLAIQAYIRVKLLTGLRRGDLLRLKISQITDDGVAIETPKTGKPVIYDWTPELRQAIEDAKSARPLDISS